MAMPEVAVPGTGSELFLFLMNRAAPPEVIGDASGAEYWSRIVMILNRLRGVLSAEGNAIRRCARRVRSSYSARSPGSADVNRPPPRVRCDDFPSPPLRGAGILMRCSRGGTG